MYKVNKMTYVSAGVITAALIWQAAPATVRGGDNVILPKVVVVTSSFPKRITEAKTTTTLSGSPARTPSGSVVSSTGATAPQRIVAAYVSRTNLGSYALEQLDGTKLTHLIYAFVGVCGTGARPSDATACQSKQPLELAIDSNVDSDMQRLAQFKARYPHVKIVISIGGGAGSQPFFGLTTDATATSRFVASAAGMLQRYPVADGIDVDWESPTSNGNFADRQTFNNLLSSLRTQLNAMSATSGKSFVLSIAVDTSSYLVNRIDYSTAQTYLDNVFAMTYDYYGDWSSQAGYQTALRNPAPGKGIQNLVVAGVPADKIVYGIAMYGRSWPSCTMNNGEPTSCGKGGGAITYKNLVSQAIGASGQGINGFQVLYNANHGVYYLWNQTSRTFISYDDPQGVLEAGSAANATGYAGLFSWQLTQDNGAILTAMNSSVNPSITP